MRREHSSILTDVLSNLARCEGQAAGRVHVTTLAARANLPHDRLKSYLGELAAHGLVDGEALAVTRKGADFLRCYHAWVRVQQLYGIQAAAK